MLAETVGAPAKHDFTVQTSTTVIYGSFQYLNVSNEGKNSPPTEKRYEPPSQHNARCKETDHCTNLKRGKYPVQGFISKGNYCKAQEAYHTEQCKLSH
jgi:hypothetical protein